MRKSFNILKFAPSRAEEYAYGRLAARSAEIFADGGIIQRPDFAYELLKLCFELGRIAGLDTPLQIRRLYDALIGVKLNSISNTNLLLWSEDFTQTSWNTTNVTPTVFASPLPIGYTAANLMTEGSAGTAFTRQQSAAVTAGAAVTAQILVRRGNTDFLFFNLGNNTGTNAGTCWINTSNGVVSGVTNTGTATNTVAYSRDMGNGYYMLNISCAVPALTSYFLIFASASASGSFTRVANSTYVVTGAQLQTGTIATDYMRTEGTTASANQSYVQTMYDWGTNDTVTRVNAIQTTAVNQPYWSTDSDLPTGIRAPLYDGSNDFMSVNDLGIFNGQAAGTSLAVVKDLAPTTGDGVHNVLFISTGTSALVNRHGIATRFSGNTFSAAGRRQDADTVANSTLANASGYNFLANLSIWAANTLELIVNNTAATAVNFSSGGGITSATDSLAFTIGAINAITNRLNGFIPSVMAGRIVLTADQRNALRALYRAYYPTLPA